jgi:DNA ligase (NAD+)
VASAVSGSTSYLINNDVTSSSGKNKKAKELNIPIISEEKFIENYQI